jgi:hypothetical protein
MLENRGAASELGSKLKGKTWFRCGRDGSILVTSLRLNVVLDHDCKQHYLMTSCRFCAVEVEEVDLYPY